MKERLPKPPKWPDRFLSWYCNPKLLEQIQGDVYELFFWRLEEEGHQRAKRSFAWDVLRLFRWSNIKRTTSQTRKINNIAMFKNYFKIGLRNVWKQRMPSTINIVGLSLAIGCCLVAFKWIEQVVVRDAYHSKSDNIFLVTPTQLNEGDLDILGYLPSDLTNEVPKEVAGIKDFTRVVYNRSEIKAEGRDFQDFVMYVDDGYYELFDFPMVHGSGSSINDFGNVIISERIAEAYFSGEFPIGKEILIDSKKYVVSAVIANAPNNTSLRHGVMLNHQILEQETPEPFRSHLFIEIDNAPAEVIENRLSVIKDIYNASHEKSPYEAVKLESLNTMAHNSEQISGGLGSSLPMEPLIMLACIGALLLTLATFNYINVATSMAMKRMKEIGVRKVIGGKKSQLISQFLIENFILVSLSMVLGLLLASVYFLPEFNTISGSDLSMDILEHKNLWKFLALLLVFITIASGAYPAFYVSSFKPVSIFRGDRQTSGKRRLTGTLLTFQMSLAVVTIMAGIMFTTTNKANQERSWGYAKENKWVVEYVDGIPNQAINQAILGLPQVQAGAGTRSAIGVANQDQDVTLKDGRQFEAYYYEVGHDYLQLLEIPLVDGEYFHETVLSENENTILVNEEFMASYQNPFEPDMMIDFHGSDYRVIGVVKNFHFRAFNDEIRPALFIRTADSLHTSLTVNVLPTESAELRDLFESTLTKLDSDKEYVFYEQSTVFDNFFEEAKGMQHIMLFVAVLAILLSGMGLYGLVSVSMTSKIKDFSIKKILGANGMQLGKDVYKRFATIIGIAVVLGSTVSVFLVGLILNSYYGGSNEEIGAFPLLLGAFILCSVAFLTIYSQVYQIKRMNPADTLRAE